MKIKYLFLKKLFLPAGAAIIITGCILLTACASQGGQEAGDPYLRLMRQNGGEEFIGNSQGPRRLEDSPYNYELWSQSGNDNRLIWYGPDYGGGGAFRAEWSNATVFLGRLGLFWNQGHPYSYYNNTFCDFTFTRSANGTAGGTSYIGIYGWSKNPMIEWYIVEDWYGEGVIGPNRIGGSAQKKGEFTVDGAVYFIYMATRPAGSGNIQGSREPFPQYFSVRQTTRRSGTISISEHFKEWERVGMPLGTNMYEAKFLVEAGSGTGWLDVSNLSFYQREE
ncbi:MAG: glycoside hydrolase family 11 protein [Treponema sp.]|nr:glycoside hydrolase family 11 protein [Treponema sp.]MCL2181140.1 glycoside hydrolase family 11 protein [Treponema sp.]